MAANDELCVCCRAREWGHSESEITNTKEGDFLARKKKWSSLNIRASPLRTHIWYNGRRSIIVITIKGWTTPQVYMFQRFMACFAFRAEAAAAAAFNV